MKPNFALILNSDGIRLLHRANNGWRPMGEVAPDDPNLIEQLRFMRKTATELAGGKFATKLVIPDEQILYSKIDALGGTDERRTQVIRLGLEGMTPYPVEELAFDWCDAGAGLAQVAVVARETLDEAEDFAAQHRFNPVSFVAMPTGVAFDHEPFFGPTHHSEALLAAGDQVDPDAEIIRIMDMPPAPNDPVAEADYAPVSRRTAKPDPAPEPTGDKHKSADPDAAQDPAAPVPFSTRRTDPPGQADEEPLRLKWVTPRIAIGKESTTSAPSKTVGGQSRPVEMTAMPVTAPKLGGGAAPAALLDDDLHQDEPAADAARIPPAPRNTTTAPTPVAANKTTPAQGDGEAASMTIFGARKAPTEAERGYLGIKLTIALVLLLALAALVSSFFTDTPITSSRFWQGLSGPSEPGELSANPALATGTDNGIDVAPLNAAPQQPEVREIELASLNAPDTPSRDVALPADENAAESATIDDGIPEMSLEDAQAIYDQSGIWQVAPVAPIDPDADRIDNLYVASIDRNVIAYDAVALPAMNLALSDTELDAFLPPPPAGTTFDLDDRGLVRATPDGALSPDGIRIIAGRPAVVPPPRPGTAPAEPVIAVDPAIAARLATIRPVARPTDLIEKTEKSRLGGRTLAELGRIRPTARPSSPQDASAEVDRTPSDLAIASSVKPSARPSGFSATVEQILARVIEEANTDTQNDTVLASAAAVAAPKTPSVPSKASVAKAATVENAIKLSKINLIGVYGSSSSRRALVRLSSGRYVKVQVGDRLDGGRVAGISTDELIYTKSGRNHSLKMPNG